MNFYFPNKKLNKLKEKKQEENVFNKLQSYPIFRLNNK